MGFAEAAGVPVPSMHYCSRRARLAGRPEFFLLSLFYAMLAAVIADSIWYQLDAAKPQGPPLLCRSRLSRIPVFRRPRAFFRSRARASLCCQVYPGPGHGRTALAGIFMHPSTLFFLRCMGSSCGRHVLGLGYIFSGQIELVGEYLASSADGSWSFSSRPRGLPYEISLSPPALSA